MPIARALLLALTATCVAAGPAAAARPNVDLATDPALRIAGETEGDASGISIAGAGDANGDGRDDLVIGAVASHNGRSGSGSAYVVFEPEGPLDDLPAILRQDRGFRIDGAAADDWAGYPVSGGGDVNGDGIDDVLVGAAIADGAGRDNAGAAYVIYGAVTPHDVDLAALSPDEGFRIEGESANDNAGGSVAGAGDVNGDGFADVVVGAPHTVHHGRENSGTAYVVYGSANPSNLDLATLTPTRGFRIYGQQTVTETAASVAGARDLNRDGLDDVIVGAAFARNRNTDSSGAFGSGSAYVVYGSREAEDLDLASLDSARGFRIDGAASDDLAGGSVAGPGDVNGDGRNDLLVGAIRASNHGRDSAGAGYVVYGKATNDNVDLAKLTTADGFRIDGQAAVYVTGAAVAGAGDVNGDRLADVMLGSYRASNNGRDGSGSGYVVYGSRSSTNVDLAHLDSARGFRIDGPAASAGAGRSVAGAGDLNGDSYADVLIGAPGVGATYAVLGLGDADVSGPVLTDFRVELWDGSLSGLWAISLKLDEPADVVFRIQRRDAGRRVRGKCRKRTRANARRRRCDLTLARALSHRGQAGQNRYQWSPRRESGLRPGRYRLLATPTDVRGNVGKRRRTGFRIGRAAG
jgi:hypothetical protein